MENPKKKTIKMKTYVLFLVIFFHLHFCKAQKSPPNTSLPKIENQLKGELDYTKGALELSQMQVNGDEILLGEIDKEGAVHFNLPEFDIKALYESVPMQNFNFQSLFLMQSCDGKDVFAKTPFDTIYSQKYDPLYIKKYGIRVAVLYPVSGEKMLSNNQYVSDSLAVGSNYHWFYIDRAMVYKDECIKTSFNGTYDIEVNVSADIQFKKGWNFIKENLVAVQDYSNGDYHAIMPKKIHFTSSSPESREVKWFIKQIAEDEKLQAAKKLYNVTPITNKQFEKWLPKKADGFRRTSYEIGAELETSACKNNARIIFENGNQKMEIGVIDGSQSPDDLEMVNFAFEMSEVKEDGGIRYVTRYNEANKSSEILSIYKDRIVLMATGANTTEEQLWKAIKTLDVASIIE